MQTKKEVAISLQQPHTHNWSYKGGCGGFDVQWNRIWWQITTRGSTKDEEVSRGVSTLLRTNKKKVTTTTRDEQEKKRE
jgi:hypothetical protein